MLVNGADKGRIEYLKAAINNLVWFPALHSLVSSLVVVVLLSDNTNAFVCLSHICPQANVA